MVDPLDLFVEVFHETIQDSSLFCALEHPVYIQREPWKCSLLYCFTKSVCASVMTIRYNLKYAAGITCDNIAMKTPKKVCNMKENLAFLWIAMEVVFTKITSLGHKITSQHRYPFTSICLHNNRSHVISYISVLFYMSFCTQFLTKVVLQQSKVGVGEHNMLGTYAGRLSKAGVTKEECRLHSTFQVWILKHNWIPFLWCLFQQYLNGFVYREVGEVAEDPELESQ